MRSLLLILTSRAVLLLVVAAIVIVWIIRNLPQDHTNKKEDGMAKRYGGRYSPDASAGSAPTTEARILQAPPAPEVPRHPLRWRPGIVTAAAVPLLIGAFFGDSLHLAINFASFAVIGIAMLQTREGLTAEAAYDARSVSRRPAIPRKLFGMVLMGVGLALAAWRPGTGLAGPVIIGLVGAALHRLAFGGDPMRNKGMEGIDGIQQDRVNRLTDEGEAYLKAMTDAALRLRDRQLEVRVAHFAATARELFRRVQDHPASLGGARRYLGVYLMGARDATVKFADQYTAQPERQIRDEMRKEYESLLDDLEANFTARSDSIAKGGREDMEIEVQVLRERLAREGVRVPASAETVIEE